MSDLIISNCKPKYGEKITIPGSKSMTNRALVLALLAGPSNNYPAKITITNPLNSRDTSLMQEGLKTYGANLHYSANKLIVTPPITLRNGNFYCGLSGTVMRFLPPLTLLTKGTSNFSGDKQASKRPMRELLQALTDLGAQIEGEHLPFQITVNKLPTINKIAIDATKTSQYLSGLFMVGALLPAGLCIKETGNNIPSLPHVTMTIDMLEKAGVKIAHLEKNCWKILPGKIKATNWDIEPDLTNAAVFCTAAAITKSKIIISNWPINTNQPGNKIISILSNLGVKTKLAPQNTNYGDLSITGKSELAGFKINMHDAGELAPTVAALAVTAKPGQISEISGISHLRGHETDRIEALKTEINNNGGDCKVYKDQLIITARPLRPKYWKTYNDHRMATTGALIGLKYPGLIIENIETVTKTFPTFTTLWNSYLGVG